MPWLTLLLPLLELALYGPWLGSFQVTPTRACRSGAKIDLLIMIAVGFGLSEALTISGGAKMVAGVRFPNPPPPPHFINDRLESSRAGARDRLFERSLAPPRRDRAVYSALRLAVAADCPC